MQKDSREIFNETYNLLRYESSEEIEIKPIKTRKYADDSNCLVDCYMGFYYSRAHIIKNADKEYILSMGHDRDVYHFNNAPFRAEILLQEIISGSRFIKDDSRESQLRQISWNWSFDDTIAVIAHHNNALMINERYWNDDVKKYFDGQTTGTFSGERPYHFNEQIDYPLYTSREILDTKEPHLDFRLAKTLADVVMQTIKSKP